MHTCRLSFLTFVAVSALFSTPLFGLDVPLTIRNREAIAKTDEPITAGIPFGRGALSDIQSLRITADGQEVPSQFRVTARWPDSSIRWIRADFMLDLPAEGERTVHALTERPTVLFDGVRVENGSSTIEVHTGSKSFQLDTSRISIFDRSVSVRYEGKTYYPAPETWVTEESGPIKAVIAAHGVWRGTDNSLLRDSLIRFTARLLFFRGRSDVRVLLTFKNNNTLGWGAYPPDGPPPLTLAGAALGALQLLPPGTYNLGSGVEKTWEIFASESASQLRESRYNSDGALAPGYTAPHPVAVAAPSYYAATQAFGLMTPPREVEDRDRQQDLDLFEKLQRSKVIQNDVVDPPGKRGITVWGHMYQDIGNWNHYGGLRWGGDFGSVSDNHYDWVFGMYLQFMRTGRLEFSDAANVFARHELDFSIYHTSADGAAYNYQKNWESRPSNDSPLNEFGPGRPSHTWLQGYVLHWLLTGDPRAHDAIEEMKEGIRQYVYESFNGEGYLRTREIRQAGWLTENLTALYRINPEGTLPTMDYGTKTIPAAIKDILKSVFDYENADGGGGYVYAGGEDEANPNQRQPLMVCYFIEPAIRAYEEVFAGRDEVYAQRLLALITRMTDWLMSVTYGGVHNGRGEYLPLQIPYTVDITREQQNEGQIPYLLMAANAAGFMYRATGNDRYLSYARRAFRDYIRYVGVEPGDTWLDSSLRTPTAYNSSVYADTESKIHGWSNRYGQYYLAAENGGVAPPDTTIPTVTITAPKSNARVRAGVFVRGRASDNTALSRVEYRIGTAKWKRVAGSLSSWKVKLSRLGRKRFVFAVRAVDSSANISSITQRTFRPW